MEGNRVIEGYGEERVKSNRLTNKVIEGYGE